MFAGQEIAIAPEAMQIFWRSLSDVVIHEEGGHCFATLPRYPGLYWFGDAALGKTIYVRASYKKLWELIQEEVQRGRPGVALLGESLVGLFQL